MASMDRGTFQSWLDAYGRAWMERDPEAAAALYAQEGTYQVTPFQEPFRGRGAIFDYWTEVARTEEGIQFNCEILAVTDGYGIATWWASLVRVPPGLPTKLDGIFLIALDVDGRCTSLREWWHKQQ
jgi:hypothetical protein